MISTNCIILEDRDPLLGENYHRTVWNANLVIYKDKIIKNRYGPTTGSFSDVEDAAFYRRCCGIVEHLDRCGVKPVEKNEPQVP